MFKCSILYFIYIYIFFVIYLMYVYVANQLKEWRSVKYVIIRMMDNILMKMQQVSSYIPYISLSYLYRSAKMC